MTLSIRKLLALGVLVQVSSPGEETALRLNTEESAARTTIISEQESARQELETVFLQQTEGCDRSSIESCEEMMFEMILRDELYSRLTILDQELRDLEKQRLEEQEKSLKMMHDSDRGFIQDLEARLASGRSSSGDPLTRLDRKDYEELIRDAKRRLAGESSSDDDRAPPPYLPGHTYSMAYGPSGPGYTTRACPYGACQCKQPCRYF